ncbi:DUF2968 domain-containing protein [Paraburkholderia sp. A1RI_3L]|uniref:DUF2968 domain-containing protein n=2 Tax=Paraburkholderia TaxID=1822464 RepID=UPI003B7CD1BE
MNMSRETVTRLYGGPGASTEATPQRFDNAVAADDHPGAAVVALHDAQATPQHGSHRAPKPADLEDVAARIAADALTSVQVFRSFEYEVSLLFDAASLGFYVVLNHAGTIRRAFQTPVLASAGQAFGHFQEQVLCWCELELRRMQLDARNAQLAALLEKATAEAERLRADLACSGALNHLVNNRQQSLRREVAQLQAQRIATQTQLDRQLRQIVQLRLCVGEGMPRNLR